MGFELGPLPTDGGPRNDGGLSARSDAGSKAAVDDAGLDGDVVADSDADLVSGREDASIDDGATADAEGATEDAGGAPGVMTGTIDVTDPARIYLIGVAAFGDGELVLTPDVAGVAGAAYLPVPYPISEDTSFGASFSFRIAGANARKGDGFAFLWQNDPRRAESLGSPGGSMGYSGIIPSVIVEFDVLANTYDAGGNQVAVTTDGNHKSAIVEVPAPFALDDGVTHYVWIDYDGPADSLSVFAANAPQRPFTALLTARVDLHAAVGAAAFIGFTAGCGGASEYAAIRSLSITYRP